jgi:hypothetical protein
MLMLLLGAVVLFLLLGGMRAFERASVKSIKALFVWIAALGGLTLALLLLLTGRGGIALGALTMFGPLIYRQWQASHGRKIGGGRSAGSSSSGRSSSPGPSRGAMSRQEAFEVLGLHPGATDTEVKEAHIRLMRGAHPDAGGSDWLASRVNQARDILLG